MHIFATTERNHTIVANQSFRAVAPYHLRVREGCLAVTELRLDRCPAVHSCSVLVPHLPDTATVAEDNRTEPGAAPALVLVPEEPRTAAPGAALEAAVPVLLAGS